MSGIGSPDLLMKSRNSFIRCERISVAGETICGACKRWSAVTVWSMGVDVVAPEIEKEMYHLASTCVIPCLEYVSSPTIHCDQGK